MTPQQAFDELYKIQAKAYEFHKSGLPSDTQEIVAWLCERFERSPDEGRQLITSKVTPEISRVFFSFCKFTAIAAVRQRDKQLVVRGLESLAIENCTLDWRDSTVALAVLYHSAQKIGVDADGLLAFVGALAVSDTTRKVFESFPDRAPRNKELAKFGIKEGTTSDGEFTYTSLP